MKKVLVVVCLAAAGVAFGAETGPAAPGGPLALAADPKVQKELGLSDEQAKAVNRLVEDVRKDASAAGEAFKTLGKTLRPAQLKRLREITYQVRGGAALGDAEVQRELKLTGKQKEEIAKVWKEEEAKLNDFLS